MPVFTQSNMSFVSSDAVGQNVVISGLIESPGVEFLQPGASKDIPLAVRQGVIKVGLDSIDKDNPSGTDSAGRVLLNCVPITVDVLKDGVADPVASVQTLDGPHLAPAVGHPSWTVRTELEVDAGQPEVPERHDLMRWTVRMTNGTDKVAQVTCRVDYIRHSSLITEDGIPISLLNGTLAIALQALAPRVSVHGTTATIGISSEIAEYIDALPESGEIRETIDVPLDVHGELLKLGVSVVSGSDVLKEVDKWAERDDDDYDSEWRREWHEKIDPQDVAVKLDITVSDVNVALQSIWTGQIPLGDIALLSPTLYLIFKNHIAHFEDDFGKGHAIGFGHTDYSGWAFGFADAIGVAPNLIDKMADAAEKKMPLIHKYFAEVLLRLVHSKYTKRFIGCRIEGDVLHVRFCDDAADPGAFPYPVVGSGESGSSGGGGRRVGGRRWEFDDGRVGGGRPEREVGSGTDPEPFGEVPPGFELGTSGSLDRLGKIDTLVFVMMENRSFDHMLGWLSRKWPDRGYICYPDDASNTVPGHSPFKMIPARNVEYDQTHFAITVDPYHNTAHTANQMNGGKMDGFSKDMMTRPNPAERRPQVPLTYYDDTELPMFNFFADQFMVCDRWFAAHPGGTYPNRWATLSGAMPYLTNIKFDDAEFGFIPLTTVFDYIREVGWAYYERNVSMLRMYANYRLDTEDVLSYERFVEDAGAGTLPPVVFIEPKITGVPPLAHAEDDHPPANLVRGQLFLKSVYDTLSASPQWANSMLVITYDEHGGFFDSEAPPGTMDGDPDWRPPKGFPKLHPEGASFLGPRVPTFIVSPMVERGSVSHTIFDHTSILKTILVRHRDKIRRNIFGLFGERVPMINHLGEALDRTEPRVDIPLSPHIECNRENFGDVPTRPFTARANVEGDAGGLEDVPYGFALARAFMPKRP